MASSASSAAAPPAGGGGAAAATVPDIESEVANVLHVLSLQSNPLKEGPEAFAATTKLSPAKASSFSSTHPAVSIEIHRLEWDAASRTLRLSAYPEPALAAANDPGLGLDPTSASASAGVDPLTRAQQLLLAAPVQVELFFPESPADPPLCFGRTDAAALVAERANASILPLERSSLLHAVSRIVGIIKQEVDSIWPPDAVDYRGEFRRALSAHLRRHFFAADLLVSLLSMSKAHHPSVRFPVPRYFYSGGAVNQSTLAAAVAAVPPLESLILKAGEDGQASSSSAQPPPPAPSLPYASCVLLHHLFFRERVGLEAVGTNGGDSNDGASNSDANDGDDDVRRLLGMAGLSAPGGGDDLPESQRPDMVFKVTHAEDARFTRAARREGTRVGLHGSPPANVFSIVSLGLRNLSGTRGMRNGAAFGDGVYLASHVEVARTFGSWGTKVWPHSTFGVPSCSGSVPAASAVASMAASACSYSSSAVCPLFAYQIIALCEFVALPQYRRSLDPSKAAVAATPSSASAGRRALISGSGGGGGGGAAAESEYFVVEDDSHLVVRLLLLFKDPAIRRQAAVACGSSQPQPPHPDAATPEDAQRQRQRQPVPRQPGQQQQLPRLVPAATATATPAGAGGGWTAHVLFLVRAVFFLVALVLMLDALDKVFTRIGLGQHGVGSGGRARHRVQ